MTQPIAGVAPPTSSEVTSMVVWPGLTALSTPPLGRLGCTLGRLYSVQLGIGNIFTLGNLLALLSIPLALQMFFAGLLPGLARRYVLTNRRVIVQRRQFSWSAKWVEEMSVGLDNFDAVDVVVLPGQAWYPAGDLIFRNGDVETFRLLGVMRPETFRRTCLKAHTSFVGVKQLVTAS